MTWLWVLGLSFCLIHSRLGGEDTWKCQWVQRTRERTRRGLPRKTENFQTATALLKHYRKKRDLSIYSNRGGVKKLLSSLDLNKVPHYPQQGILTGGQAKTPDFHVHQPPHPQCRLGRGKAYLYLSQTRRAKLSFFRGVCGGEPGRPQSPNHSEVSPPLRHQLRSTWIWFLTLPESK